MSSTYTDKNSTFSRLTKKHSQFGTFSQPCSNRTFSNCLSHNSPAEGYHCGQNNYSFDALQAYCFGIKYKTVMTVIFPGGEFLELI